MKPMQGVRVVEATQMVAGPWAGAILAEQGADVIKVEMPDGVGDRYRLVGSRRGDMGASFQGFNRGKRSIALDTKDPEGLKVMQRLIGSADVFVQNFRPGTADRLGIGAAEMMAAYPELIYVSVSGFGSDGPEVDQKVYDYVVQARTGMAAIQAIPPGTGTPELVHQIVVDKVTAMTTSQAITAALFQRERHGGGQHVQLAMIDVGAWFFHADGMMDLSLLGDDVVDVPHVADSYGAFATSDGHIVLMVMGSDRSWPKLANAFVPHLVDDPRFADREIREQNIDALMAEFAPVVAALTTQQAIDAMRANDVPGSAITPRDQVHLDPQLVHNDTFVVVDDGPAGLRREVRPPVRFGSDDARGIPASAPAVGAHAHEILAEVGYSLADIEGMSESGILGPE